MAEVSETMAKILESYRELNNKVQEEAKKTPDEDEAQAWLCLQYWQMQADFNAFREFFLKEVTTDVKKVRK
jgi:hypothetical protein